MIKIMTEHILLVKTNAAKRKMMLEFPLLDSIRQGII
jgi:hypothetical protein